MLKSATVIMSSTKESSAASPISFEEGISSDDNDVYVRNQLQADDDAMQRMGRKQELVRYMRPFTMICFSSLSSAPWQSCMLVFTQCLIDGGRPNAIYSLIWTFVGFVPIYLSMAEMSSMAPIAGAQYHWVSEFAPEKYQKVLSYITGYVWQIS